jgi:uncharacterized protein HemX
MGCGKEAEMAGKVIVVVVVIAVIVAAVVLLGRQRTARQAKQAQALRSDAGEQSGRVEKRESAAAEVDARARAAQAESDAKAAEAERLALSAERQKAQASRQRAEVDDQLHRADEIDPDLDNAKEGDATAGGSERTRHESSSTDGRDREPPR